VLGKIDPDVPVTTAVVPLELVALDDAVVLDALTLDVTVETSPGIAMICKSFGWLLTNACDGLLKLTKTIQFEGERSLDTTILISDGDVMLQLAAKLHTFALQNCEVMKLLPVRVTVKPGYTESGTILSKVGIRIERAPKELTAPALGGLLNFISTTQDPFWMELETSTMATFGDIRVQFGIREPQMSTVQFCVPLRKFLPKTVIIDPLYTAFGIICVMFASSETLKTLRGL
jgi:hypothetical protein